MLLVTANLNCVCVVQMLLATCCSSGRVTGGHVPFLNQCSATPCAPLTEVSVCHSREKHLGEFSIHN